MAKPLYNADLRALMGPPGRTRTCNLRLRRPLHYPVVLRAAGAQYPIPCRVVKVIPVITFYDCQSWGVNRQPMVVQCYLPSSGPVRWSAGLVTTDERRKRWPKCGARCHRRCSPPLRCGQIYRAVDSLQGWQCHGSTTRERSPVASD
jgi:hypothetical protein